MSFYVQYWENFDSCVKIGIFSVNRNQEISWSTVFHSIDIRDPKFRNRTESTIQNATKIKFNLFNCFGFLNSVQILSRCFIEFRLSLSFKLKLFKVFFILFFLKLYETFLTHNGTAFIALKDDIWRFLWVFRVP